MSDEYPNPQWVMTAPGSWTLPDESERLNWFRQLAHVVHLGRCTRFPFGGCTRHQDAEYFTPKDNDIASAVIRWLEYGDRPTQKEQP